MVKLRGFDITTDWKPQASGEIMMHVRIKRWYMPLFIVRVLRNTHVPLRYWFLVFWRYYVKPVTKKGK